MSGSLGNNTNAAHSYHCRSRNRIHIFAYFRPSINFLHLGGLLVRAFNLLKRRQVVVARIVVVVDAQAELDHAVDAPGELRRLIQREARRQQRRVEPQQGTASLTRPKLRTDLPKAPGPENQILKANAEWE